MSRLAKGSLIALAALLTLAPMAPVASAQRRVHFDRLLPDQHTLDRRLFRDRLRLGVPNARRVASSLSSH